MPGSTIMGVAWPLIWLGIWGGCSMWAFFTPVLIRVPHKSLAGFRLALMDC